MTKRDILSVAFKILGVVSVMYAMTSIPVIRLALNGIGIHHIERGANPYVFLGITIIIPILYLVMAYFLMRWGDLIAEKLVREKSVISTVETIQWERTAFLLSLRIIGVLCLVRGTPQLVENLSRLVGRFTGSYVWTSIIGSIVLLVIGGYLLLSGKHLVRLAFREWTEILPNIDK